MNKHPLLMLLLLSLFMLSSMHAQESPVTLDFATAVRRTLDRSLILNQDWNEAQGKKGMIAQARLYPNPLFNYNIETSQNGWKERQDIYTINQLVLLGGKREKQIQVATYDSYAASTGYEVSKLEQLNSLSKAFIRVAAAQEDAQLAMQHVLNAKEGLRLINTKVEVGKASRIQQNKACIALSLAELNFKQAVAEFRASKNSLALLWASSSPDFETVLYPFFEISKPLSFEEYLNKLCDQPEITQSLYKYMAAYHKLRLEKAGKVPDVTVTLGYGYDQGNKGVVAGVTVPIPIWDRNQGNIRRAYHEVLKTEEENKQLKLFLENKLSNAYLELNRAYQEVEDLRNSVLPASTETLDLAYTGYREGKLEYWEVLNAQQFYLDVQEKHIEALTDYHNMRAEIEYLITERYK